MKKIVILLFIILISANCVSANGFHFNALNNLTKKQSNQGANSQLGPVKPAYDDALTPSEQATLFYNENNIKSSFDKLITIKESDRTAQDWVLLGNILQDQEKTSDAIFMYQRAILVNPKFYKSYYNLGNTYLEEEKPFLAIENYRKSNSCNNQFAYAYYNLGCAYLKTGNLKKAKIVFLKAIELKNTEPNFHYNLAYTYKMLKNPKLSKQYLGFYNKLMENNK